MTADSSSPWVPLYIIGEKYLLVPGKAVSDSNGSMGSKIIHIFGV